MPIEFRRRACQNNQRLSKATFLAMLPTNIDTTTVKEVSTGQEISVVGVAEIDIQRNINSGTWARIERSQPRKFYVELDNSDWDIISFNPIRREVCLEIRSGVGTRITTQILPNLSNSALSSFNDPLNPDPRP